MTRPDPNAKANRLDDDLEGGDAPHKPADDTEQVYFEGSPMLRGEIGRGLLYILGGVLLIALPIVWGIWRDRQGEPHPWWPWYVILACVVIGFILISIPFLWAKTVRYRIGNYRIDFERGIFSKAIDTLELWHVDDLKFHQSFLARLFGVGTITILSNDNTTPELNLRGLPNPRSLFETLRQRVISVKRQRGVIKMDT
jgi:membrane protein YdbS with pleckstrin-like domain